MKMSYYTLINVLILVYLVKGENNTEVVETEADVTKILSRKKRFLVFPEGSSLQLVFCNSYATIFNIGGIFLWGITAALAWELPQDPYSPFDHKADPLHRRIDSKVVYYTNEYGKVVHSRPYKKKLIVNPAFAKRSVDSQQIEKKELDEFKIYRKQMHGSGNKRDFFYGPSVEFHRSTRFSLYQKIEAMLQGGGSNGRECVLKTLCIVGKTPDDSQGSFLQEILRATFTLPKGISKEDLEDYDAAFTATEPCEDLYPDCPDLSSESNAI